MQAITLYLIKDNFLNVPRYSLNGVNVIENQASIFNEGVIFERNQRIEKYIKEKGSDYRKINRADSEFEVFFRETDNPNPWWRSFWRIENPLKNKSTDIVVIITHADRIFVVAHGHGRFLLNPLSLEIDFGLKTALNAIDPEKIRATGLFTPSDIGMRTKKQTGRDTTIEQYEINIFNSLLKDIAGQVKNEYRDIFKNIDGADCLKFNHSGNAESLLSILSDLKLLYDSKKYRKSGFKWIDNFRQIRDKDLINELDKALISALRRKSSAVIITYPAILPSTIEPAFKYTGFGKAKKNEGYFRELDIEKQFYNKIEPFSDSLTVDDLKSQQLILIDEDENKEIDSYKIYQCLYAETNFATHRYFLEKGIWYRVDKEFLSEIDDNLSLIPLWTKVIPYELKKVIKEASSENTHKEYAFNSQFCSYLKEKGDAELLDANLVPYRNSTIEICDILYMEKGKRYLFHNKYKYSSSALSHLFSQGNTSAELLIDEPFRKAANKKIESINLKLPVNGEPFVRDNYTVVYGIITKKNANGEYSIPLFSKINLDLFSRNLRKLGYSVNVCYIEFIP